MAENDLKVIVKAKELAVVSAIVDGEVIKADTWYTVKDGKFVEVWNPAQIGGRR